MMASALGAKEVNNAAWPDGLRSTRGLSSGSALPLTIDASGDKARTASDGKESIMDGAPKLKSQNRKVYIGVGDS